MTGRTRSSSAPALPIVKYTDVEDALAPHQPFGGFKWSGVGVENGPWGLYGFTELQVIHRSRL